MATTNMKESSFCKYCGLFVFVRQNDLVLKCFVGHITRCVNILNTELFVNVYLTMRVGCQLVNVSYEADLDVKCPYLELFRI